MGSGETGGEGEGGDGEGEREGGEEKRKVTKETGGEG